MFSLLNLNKVNTHLAIMVKSPNNDILELTIGPTIAKRNKEELVPDKQYLLLNAYLDYKGDEFKQLLYNTLLEANYAVEECVFSKGLENQPIKAIHRILDMFDMDDVYKFVKDVFRIIPPSNLEASFNTQIEQDGLGTRAQTYIQQDYFELAALTIPIKAVLGILGQYAIRKESCISPIHKEYILYKMLSTHAIANHPAMLKIKAGATILIDLTVPKGEATAVTVIEKKIPSSELSEYVLGVVVIQKVGVAAIVTDSREGNVITRIYNYIINKLKPKGGSGNKIRDKKPLSDTDSGVGDKESVVESYRVISNITIGTEAEFNHYAGSMDMLIRDMCTTVDRSLLSDIHRHCQCFKEIPITREQVVLAGYVFKNIIDPRSLEYININGIINIISLAFVLLWESGHREVALILISKPVISNSNDIDINTTPNVRLVIELKTKLAELYPYEKQLNKNKTVSIVEAAITDLTYNIFKNKWVPNAPKHCLEEYFGNNPVKVLSPDLKNHIARLIIYIEEEMNEQPSNDG